jgi:hypothetical protein
MKTPVHLLPIGRLTEGGKQDGTRGDEYVDEPAGWYRVKPEYEEHLRAWCSLHPDITQEPYFSSSSTVEGIVWYYVTIDHLWANGLPLGVAQRQKSCIFKCLWFRNTVRKYHPAMRLFPAQWARMKALMTDKEKASGQ